MTAVPSKSDLRKNLRALEARLDSQPLDLDARMRLARTCRLLDMRDDAVAQYATVARYLSLAGHPLQAIAVLKELLQVAPDHEDTQQFLAHLYARAHSAADVATQVSPGATPDETRGFADAMRPSPGTSGPQPVAAVRLPDMDTAEKRVEQPTVYAPEDVGARLEPDEHDGLESSDVARGTPLETKTPAEPAAGAHTESTPSDHVEAAFENVPDLDLGDDYELVGTMTTGDLLLPQVPLFSSLSPDAFIHLSNAMVFLKAQPGEIIFRQGDPSDSCIVIARGNARVSRRSHPQGDDVEILQLGEGDLAGVFALVGAHVRLATLTAVTALEYFEIDRVAIDSLVKRHPAMKTALAAFTRDRLLSSTLAALPFFQRLDARARQSLVRRFQDQAIEPGRPLLDKSAMENGLWVVLSGTLRVARGESSPDGAPMDLGPGDYLGSLAELGGEATDLGAVAVEAVTCAHLPPAVFTEALEGHPDLEGARARCADAGMMVGKHIFAGNGTLAGQLVAIR